MVVKPKFVLDLLHALEFMVDFVVPLSWVSKSKAFNLQLSAETQPPTSNKCNRRGCEICPPLSVRDPPHTQLSEDESENILTVSI